MTVRRAGSTDAGASFDPGALRSVVAVCAHPDDESFGLGAVLHSLTSAGASATVLSFTHGEASSLHGMPGDLGVVRAAELAAAARALSVRDVMLLDHPDGALSDIDEGLLVEEVASYATKVRAAGLLTFDLGGITGHPDHKRATEVALLAGAQLELPVLAWSIPSPVAEALNAEFGTCFIGRTKDEIDLVVHVDRSVQKSAIACHVSQAAENRVLWRRLELMGETEWLRWLWRPSSVGQGPPAGR